MSQAKFITLEGTEGVGKSTQCSMLATAIEREFGVDAEVTREPGGTFLGESIRSILLDPNIPAMDGATELLLMFAGRAEHLAKVIKPALADNRWVICDRFTDATYAYQGGGRGLEKKVISDLQTIVQKGFAPDLTVVLDLEVDVALKRVATRGEPDRFEQERHEFFERVRATYLRLVVAYPERIALVDAAPAVDVVHRAVMDAVRERLI